MAKLLKGSGVECHLSVGLDKFLRNMNNNESPTRFNSGREWLLDSVCYATIDIELVLWFYNYNT